MVRSVLSGLAAVVLCMSSAMAATLMEKVPKDAIFSVHMKVGDAGTPGWSETALGKILQEREMQIFLRDPLKQLEALFKKFDALSDVKMADLQGCFARECALSVLLSKPGTPPNVILLGRGSDKDVPRRLIETLPSMAKKMSPNLPLQSDGGVLRLLGPAGEISLAADGDMLVLVMQQGMGDYKQLLADTPEESLAKAKNYAPLYNPIQGKGSFSWYLNVAGLWPLLEAEAEGNRELTPVLQALKAMALLDIQALGQSIEAAPPGFTDRFHIVSSAPEEGLLGLLGSEPISEDMLKLVPASARFVAAERIRMDSLMALIRKAVTAAQVMPPEQIDGMVQMATAQIGFNPETDFFNSLGDEALLFAIDPQEVGGLPLMGINGLVGIVKIKDRAKVEKAMGILTKIGLQAANQAPIPSQPLKVRRGDHSIRGIKLLSGVLAPCYTLTDKYMILSTGPHGVVAALEAMAGNQFRLMDQDDFQKALKRVGGKMGVGLQYNARSSFTMPGGDLMSASMLGGMLLPALSRARNAARKANDMNSLAQIGKATIMYSSEQYYDKYPASLADLYDDGEGIIGDPKALVSAKDGQGFHFLRMKDIQFPPAGAMIAWTAKGSHDDGRNVVYGDSHVRFLKEAQFKEGLEETKALLKKKKIEFEILAPWTPPGLPATGPMPSVTFFDDLEKNPEQMVQWVLDTFKLYKLPPASIFNKHLYASAGVMERTETGLVFLSHGPLPFGNGMSGQNVSSLISGANWTAIPVIAAIAIPNLLESRMHANEANAVAALKSYVTAQTTWQKARFKAENAPAGQYCPTLAPLAKKDLMPGVFAKAKGPANAWQGYYFVPAKKNTNWAFDMALYAIPAAYDKSGINTFFIDGTGVVRFRDMEGNAPDFDADKARKWDVY